MRVARNLVLSLSVPLLWLSHFASAQVVSGCGGMAYADGGLYCRLDSLGGCTHDLGDFPTKRAFQWHVMWDWDTKIYYLAERNDGFDNFTAYKDQVYIDTSPGAFAPMRFTADNTTLAEGETSWAWAFAYGIPFFTPTGDLSDGTPMSQGTVRGQGFQMVDVEGYPGLQQAYWNQTKFDEMYRGAELGGFLPIMCRGNPNNPTIHDGGVLGG